jgi:class 3 adenylate cyclase
MDLAGWLRSLGLERYEAAFRENEIDDTVLPNLTAEDLRDLGVSIVGHRRKLLDAIAALRADTEPKAAPAAPKSAAQPTFATAAEAAGERGYLTVMFCDLVDSTGIAARLDAEEWRDLVNAYLDDASAAVMEMGGHVAKKLSDGLMVLFGYPFAHENDAERASRAALSIQRALADLNRKNAGIGKPELKIRIGLETGVVVVDATGEVYGDAPNTAARVQALAEPSAVLITAQVQRLVAGLFVVEERGCHQLKGVPEPVTLFSAHPGKRRRTPLFGASAYAVRRSRGGNGDADAALGAGAAGRRAVRADRRRAGPRQVSSD